MIDKENSLYIRFHTNWDKTDTKIKIWENENKES